MKRLCAIVFLIGFVTSKKLPSYIEPCPRSVKEAGPCILKNVKIIQPKMEKGIPEMLIPALNPLDITESRLDTNTIKAAFTNAKLYNLHNFELLELKFNIETLDVYISINFPHMWSTSGYRLQGKILIFEFDSHGKAEGNFTNLWADLKGKMELYDKEGKKHFKINKVDMNLEVRGASLYFGDIFPKNKELTENANKVLNENSKDVIKDFLPVLIETVKSIVVGIANRIFEKYSFDDLFPGDTA